MFPLISDGQVNHVTTFKERQHSQRSSSWCGGTCRFGLALRINVVTSSAHDFMCYSFKLRDLILNKRQDKLCAPVFETIIDLNEWKLPNTLIMQVIFVNTKHLLLKEDVPAFLCFMFDFWLLVRQNKIFEGTEFWQVTLFSSNFDIL